MSESTDRRNAMLRPWPKGVSGNPGGTSRAVRQVRDMLAKLHPDCEKALRGMIENWADDPRAACAAIQIVYARSIGKERESLHTPKDRKTDAGLLDEHELRQLSDSQLDRIDQILREQAS